MTKLGLIILDRDGVLNSLTIDPEQGTIDSPLHPSQVIVPAGVPEALSQMTEAGYGLAIVTNQPSAAKGKTTRKNLEETHARILELIQAKGGRILSSHICFHRREDNCACRKPKTGSLKAAFEENPGFDKKLSWMVGDGLTDVEAGEKFGVKTAFIGDNKAEFSRLFSEKNIHPTISVGNLTEFANYLINRSQHDNIF